MIVFKRKPRGGFGCMFQFAILIVVFSIIMPIACKVIRHFGFISWQGGLAMVAAAAIMIITMVSANKAFPLHF